MLYNNRAEAVLAHRPGSNHTPTFREVRHMAIRKITINGFQYQLVSKCLADGCFKKSRSMGFCNVHYQRHINNIPMEGNPKPTLLERIMAKVVLGEGDCWIWTGAKAGRPPDHLYGYINIDGRLHRVHRVIYELQNNVELGELFLLHKCDTPLCVNPDHCFPGTHQDNMDDMINKGRDNHAKGEDNHSKLTSRDVRQIRWQYKSGAICADLGRKYGVHAATIKSIVTRKKWKHI